MMTTIRTLQEDVSVPSRCALHIFIYIFIKPFFCFLSLLAYLSLFVYHGAFFYIGPQVIEHP